MRCYQHPTPLCRRPYLPHSKITCATLIIPIILLFYKGNLHGLVCFRAVQGIYIPAQLFCSPRRCPRGGRDSPTPSGRSAGKHTAHTPIYFIRIYTEENTMRKALIIYGLSLALVFSLSACTPTQEDAPEDTSTPEVTEPADTSEPEQTAPAEPDDQEPQETAETTADTEPTEAPVPETPTAETPAPEPVQQSTQEQQQETQTPVIPSDGGGNPGSDAGNDAGQSTGNQGGSGNTGGNSGSVNPGQTTTPEQPTTPPTSGGSEESVGGSSNPGSLTEEEQANLDAFKDTVEGMGGYYDPSTGATWVP